MPACLIYTTFFFSPNELVQHNFSCDSFNAEIYPTSLHNAYYIHAFYLRFHHILRQLANKTAQQDLYGIDIVECPNFKTCLPSL